MTRKEFMSAWRTRRTHCLKEMYAGDPHGKACLIAALNEVDSEGLKLWRKYRKTWATCKPEDVLKLKTEPIAPVLQDGA